MSILGLWEGSAFVWVRVRSWWIQFLDLKQGGIPCKKVWKIEKSGKWHYKVFKNRKNNNDE